MEKEFKNKDLLIDAAIEEFSENDYEKASINTILKNANISKGTFYYHFKNKEDLYFFILGIFVEKKKKALMSKLKPEYLELNIFDLFEKMARAGLEFAIEDPKIFKFGEKFVQESGNPIFKKAMDKFGVGFDDYLDPLINKAFERGDFNNIYSKEFTKNIIIHLFKNYTQIFELKGENFSYEKVKEALDELVVFMKQGLANKN